MLKRAGRHFDVFQQDTLAEAKINEASGNPSISRLIAMQQTALVHYETLHFQLPVEHFAKAHFPPTQQNGFEGA